MTLRQYERYMRITAETKIQAQEEAWWRTAAMTAEFVNIIGAAHSTKKKPWKTVNAKKFFDNWLGKTSNKEDFRERWNKAMKLQEARKQREAAKKVL